MEVDHTGHSTPDIFYTHYRPHQCAWWARARAMLRAVSAEEGQLHSRPARQET